MKVEHLNINRKVANTFGFENVEFKKLGAVVAFVGRNGSGKSRLLKLIKKHLLETTGAKEILNDEFSNLPPYLSKHLKGIIAHKAYIKAKIRYDEIQNILQANSSDPKILNEFSIARTALNLATTQNPHSAKQYVNLQQQTIQANAIVKTAISQYVHEITHDEIKALQLIMAEAKSDSNTNFESIIAKVTEEGMYNELKAIRGSALAYLSSLPHLLVLDDLESRGDESVFAQKESYKRFTSLKNIIKAFLNKDLTWERAHKEHKLSVDKLITETKGIWKLNGRPFSYEELSSGEKILFAYSLLFFLLDQNPSVRLKDSIIFIDEPELHLHPESEIAIIQGIRKIIQEKGQLFIATHSLSILSHLNQEEIFMVKDSEIMFPSRHSVEKSLIELMGIDEHIFHLSNFVNDAQTWAFVNFMTQCFEQPEVITYSQKNDPEVEIFIKTVKGKRNINVLDFGAGQGRLLSAFINQNILEQINYYALEPNKTSLVDFPKDKLKGLYHSHDQLPANQFNIILLCNVLHEIPIKEWPAILNKLTESLCSGGHIMIIEDQHLPKGEMIGKEGFIILNSAATSILFNLENPPIEIKASEDKYKDRIYCAMIRKELISAVTIDSVRNAIKTVKNHAFDQVKLLRTSEYQQNNKVILGKRSALYSQLYVNSCISLEALE